ncbi:hypothetical protein B0H16DRAFT_1811829 [Mycena metata]|uniref:Uncharacterized protein n=1 Tax=Mycena metata TaxID=1033252 RepID=A0AAD7H5E2_9AGAR|nr:hypothetical protein B0H16DRAFT_1811829 [Mycena metata]
MLTCSYRIPRRASLNVNVGVNGDNGSCQAPPFFSLKPSKRRVVLATFRALPLHSRRIIADSPYATRRKSCEDCSGAMWDGRSLAPTHSLEVRALASFLTFSAHSRAHSRGPDDEGRAQGAIGDRSSQEHGVRGTVYAARADGGALALRGGIRIRGCVFTFYPLLTFYIAPPYIASPSTPSPLTPSRAFVSPPSSPSSAPSSPSGTHPGDAVADAMCEARLVASTTLLAGVLTPVPRAHAEKVVAAAYWDLLVRASGSTWTRHAVVHARTVPPLPALSPLLPAFPYAHAY